MANLQTGFTTFLALPLAAGATTATLGTVPTATQGRLHLYDGSQEEWVSYTGVSGVTVTGLTRNLSQTADPATGGTGLTWIAGTPVDFVAMHDQIVDKTQSNTFAGTQTFTDIAFTGTTTPGLKVKSLTTAQRTATTPSNGAIVYDSDAGVHYQYIGGARSTFATGTTSNASTTVAGKVEAPTQTEVEQLATTGGTGALVFVTPTTINPASITTATPAGGDLISFADISATNYLRSATLESIGSAINVRSFTAGENVTAGDLLYMDSDGSAYKTVRKASATSQIGSVTGLDSDGGALAANAVMVRVEYLTTNKAIICYKKSADNFIYGTVVSFSRGTPTVGAEQVMSTALEAGDGFDLAVLSSTLFVVGFKKASDDKLYCTACTVSGTTITAGTEVKMYDTNTISNTTMVSVCKVSATSVAIAGRDSVTADPTVIAGTISGTVITPGTAVAMKATTMGVSSGVGLCYVSDGVIATVYDNATNFIFNMATISGTTITAKTELDLGIAIYNAGQNGFGYSDRVMYIEGGRFIFRTSGLATPDPQRLVTVNVTNQSAWTSAVMIGNYYIPTDTATLYSSVPLYIGNNLLAFVNQTTLGSDVRLRIMELGYNGLRLKYDTTIGATAGDCAIAKLTLNQDKLLIVRRETGSTNLGYSLYWNTEDQFVGACKTTTSAAGTVPVTTYGAAAISGLTTGQQYYVGDAGAVATSGTKQIGVATTTTSLHLR